MSAGITATIAWDAAPEPCGNCGVPTRARDRLDRPRHVMCLGAAAGGSRPGSSGIVRDRPAPSGAVRATGLPDAVRIAVRTAAQKAEGDIEQARELLSKQAIPLVMALLDAGRSQGRLGIVRRPAYPDIMRRPGPKQADQIWEARPSWRNDRAPAGPREVLDVNAAYLSALKCWLPYTELRHSTAADYVPHTAGVHLITPPAWQHTDLPNPMGQRDLDGPVWITTPTLRMLLRCTKLGLSDAPTIHEQWIGHASEALLEPLRQTLAACRTAALEERDELLLHLTKTMYAKFVSTCGESRANHHIRRPDWEHSLRAQAFSNLFWRAHKAYREGLTVVRVGGTDELDVIGDWRTVWNEGRGLGDMMRKTDKA